MRSDRESMSADGEYVRTGTNMGAVPQEESLCSDRESVCSDTERVCVVTKRECV